MPATIRASARMQQRGDPTRAHHSSKPPTSNSTVAPPGTIVATTAATTTTAEQTHQEFSESLNLGSPSTSDALSAKRPKTSSKAPSRIRNNQPGAPSNSTSASKYSYVHHDTLEELRNDETLPRNWSSAHLARSHVKIIDCFVEPPRLPENLETILNHLSSDVSEHYASGSELERRLAVAQQKIALSANPRTGFTDDQCGVGMFSGLVYNIFFGKSSCRRPLEFKIPGNKIIRWQPRSIVENNLCRVYPTVTTSGIPNRNEDVAYLLSFAQHTGCREPYLLACHTFGKIRLFKAVIGDMYMAKLKSGDLESVDEDLEVQLIGSWDLNKADGRIKYVAMLMDLSKRFGDLKKA